VNYQGYSITKLEHLLALKALESMADDGRAALVMGAAMLPREPGGKGAQWIFENYLYGHYNVVGNFEMAGELYAKQGTKFPIRVIMIDGRKATPERGVFAPETVERLTTWDQVWAESERIRNEIAAKRKSMGATGRPGVPVPAPRPSAP